MPRRKVVAKRQIPGDIRFNSILVSKFINVMMKQGKKNAARKIFYGAMDIVDNKKTMLMIMALNTASEEQYSELTRWLTTKEFDPEEKISSVVNIFDSLGVKSKVEEMINEYYQTSLKSLPI